MSAGHVTLIKICSSGRVGKSRIFNYFTTPNMKCGIFLLCLQFAILNSLYSEVILKPNQVICLKDIF